MRAPLPSRVSPSLRRDAEAAACVGEVQPTVRTQEGPAECRAVHVQRPAREHDLALVGHQVAVGVLQPQQMRSGGDEEAAVDECAALRERQLVGVDGAAVVGPVAVRVLEHADVVRGLREHLLGGHRVRLGGLEHEQPPAIVLHAEHRVRQQLRPGDALDHEAIGHLQVQRPADVRLWRIAWLETDNRDTAIAGARTRARASKERLGMGCAYSLS